MPLPIRSAATLALTIFLLVCDRADATTGSKSQNRAEFSGQVGRVGSMKPVCLSAFAPFLIIFLLVQIWMFDTFCGNVSKKVHFYIVRARISCEYQKSAAQCEESERSCCVHSLKLRISTLTSKCNIPDVAEADRQNRGSGPNAPSPGAAHASPVTPVTHKCCIK